MLSGSYHETYLPTFSHPPQTHTRISCAHEDSRWTRSYQRASCERSQTLSSVSLVARIERSRGFAFLAKHLALSRP